MWSANHDASLEINAKYLYPFVGLNMQDITFIVIYLAVELLVHQRPHVKLYGNYFPINIRFGRHVCDLFYIYSKNWL